MAEPKLVRIVRAPLYRAPGIDITVKSASGWARAFAPTWEMVMGHKSGEMSDEEYIRDYHAILEGVSKETWRELYLAGLATGEVTVLCYCRDGKFCHTHVLIDWAVARWPKAFRK